MKHPSPLSSTMTSLVICLLLTIGNDVFGQLPGWSYVAPVVLTETSGSNLTDYQALILVDTQTPIGAGKMNSDGSDIRFAGNIDGTNLLDFWVDTGLNTTTTEIWVKVPSMPASIATTIYLFYGKPSALSASNGDSTFIFFDDFASGTISPSKWAISTGTGSDIATAASGYTSIIDDGSTGLKTPQTLSSFAQPFILDLKFQYRFTGVNTHYGFVLSSGFQSMGIYTGAASGNHGGACANSDVAEVIFGANSDSPSFTSQYTSDDCLSPFSWHDFETKISSSTVAMKADGLVFETGQSTGTAGPFYLSLGGYWNDNPWGSTNGSETWYDDIRIRKYSTSEPTTAIGVEALTSSIVATGGPICSGNSITVTAVVDTSGGLIPPYTYAWSPSTNLSCTSCQNPIANPTTTITYTVVVTDSIGTVDSASAEVNVSSSVPVADAGTDSSICLGDTVQLVGSGGVLFEWSPSTGLNDSSLANPTANPSVTTTYMLLTTNGCGSDSDYVVVTVNPIPIITSSDTAMCPGDSVPLLASGASSYVWSPGSSLSDSTIANPVASPSSTTVYSISATSGAGCFNIDSITVDVDSVPVIIAITSQDTICPAGIAQLNVLGATDCNDYDISSIAFSPPSSAGTFVSLGDDQVSSVLPIGFTFNFYCNDYTNFYISSNGFITFNNSTDNGCCSGDFIPTAGTPNNLIALAWEDLNPNSGGTISYATFGVAPNRTLVASYNAVAHYGGGNFVTSQVVLYEGSNVIEIHTTNMPTDGGSHTMGIENIDGTIAHPVSGRNQASWSAANEGIRFSPLMTIDTTLNYTWTPGTGLSDSTIMDPVASPTSTTTYIVEASVGSCSSYDTITVYVDTANFIIIGATSTNVCQGDSVILSVIGTPGMPDTSTWTYTWSPSAGLSNTTIASPISVPLSNITYQLDVTNACGSFTDTISLISKLAPIAEAGPDTSFCSGGSVQLSASGGVTYLWSPNQNLSCTACDKSSATPTGDMMYYVEVTDSFGCTASDSVLVEVNGQPITAVSAKPAVCQPGDTTQLSVIGGCSQSSTIQVGTGTAVAQFYGPFIGNSTDAHYQFLYTASELTAAGLVAGNISNVAFNVINKNSTGPFIDFTLSMANTSTTCLVASSGWLATTQVYGPTNYTTTVGWNTVMFTTPFNWDGVSNIVIETCYNNPTGGGPGGADDVEYETGFSCDMTMRYYSNSGNGCLLSATYDYSNRCNIQFSCMGNTLDSSMAFTWTPGSTLTDSSIINPIANPSGITSYVVSADDGGCITSDTITIYVDTTIIQTTADTGFCTGASAVISASSTTPVASYLWSPSTGLNNTVIQSPTASPTVTTQYTVDVSGMTGCVQSDTILITVADPPVVGFTSLTSGLDVTLTNNTINGTTYLWDFDDGYLSSLQDPVHTYAFAGTYNICLTATNACGSFTYCASIAVTALGCVNTVAAFDTIMVGANVVFTDLSSDADTWNWDFGDGNTSTSQNPVNSYAAVDSTYNVCLITGNPCSSDTVCKVVTITVSGAPCTVPVSGFTESSVGLDAVFTDGSSDATSWTWDFGDGNTSSVQNPVHTYGADGTYSVCLIASNGCGSDTSCMNVTVAASSCTSTSAAFNSTVTGSVVGFIDGSTDATSWSWDFGDGNTSTAQNPAHTYISAGTYIVCLVVANPCSGDTICDSITTSVCSMPVASFSSSSTNLNADFSDASSNATSWLWDFGDGNTSTSQNPSNTYAAAGTYIVCQLATNPCGTDSLCTNVTILTGCTSPTASFSSSTASLTASFTDASSNATSWLWDFGDGSGTSTTQSPSYTYAAAGTYVVCLYATNTCGTDSLCTNVTIVSGCPMPVASFSTVTNNLSLTVTDASSNTTLWLWDFGDGTTSTSQNPSYTYADTGNYTVCLFATNSCGSDSSCSSVTVAICTTPVAGFTATANNLTVSFSDVSVDATSWSWDFGDGNTSNVQNPTYTYSTAGTYMVCQTVSSGCDTAQSCFSIIVSDCGSVFSVFSYTSSTLTVNFSDLSINADSWYWDFGDGFNSSVSDPTHIYLMPGNYTVCLTATNACATDTSCVEVNVVITGLDQEASITSMELYPNPTEGLLHLSVPSDITSSLNVSVYNLIGEVVFTIRGSELEVTDIGSSSTVYVLKLDQLSNGSYFLKVQSDEEIHMEQFILSK